MHRAFCSDAQVDNRELTGITNRFACQLFPQAFFS